MANTKAQRKLKKSLKMALNNVMKVARRNGHFMVLSLFDVANPTVPPVLYGFMGPNTPPYVANASIANLVKVCIDNNVTSHVRAFTSPIIPNEKVASLFRPHLILETIRNAHPEGKPVGVSFPKLFDAFMAVHAGRFGGAGREHVVREVRLDLQYLIDQGLVVRSIFNTFWDKEQFRSVMNEQGVAYLPITKEPVA